MHRCYVPQADLLATGALNIEGEEAKHALKVMRLRVGDECEVFNGCGQAAVGRICSTTSSSHFSLGELRPLPPMPPVAEITLALAIPKGSNMDLIVQKAVEMGVSRIIPLISERTIVRLDARDAAAKTTKWSRTVLEACKQCGVNHLPVVETPQTYASFLQRQDLPETKLQCAIVPHARPLRELLETARTAARRSCVILIGPEGDFSPAEYAAGEAAGFLPASLGPIILRVETAVFLAVASARYALD